MNILLILKIICAIGIVAPTSFCYWRLSIKGFTGLEAIWLASSTNNGKTGLEASVFMAGHLLGFLREELGSVFHLPTRPIEMKVTIIPSAFEPLEK
jgi:hypothetical protein